MVEWNESVGVTLENGEKILVLLDPPNPNPSSKFGISTHLYFVSLWRLFQ
jgi:hypothetical protein